jgi:hypothetical protein
MTLDDAISNPPQVGLCHRVANAEKNFQKEEINKSISELEKYMAGVDKSIPGFIGNDYGELLIAEAEMVIDIISGNGEQGGIITGGVFNFNTNEPISGASILLSLSGTEIPFETTSDENGFFVFNDIPLTGTYILYAEDSSGAFGSVQGSILPTENATTSTILIDQPGSGSVQGYITSDISEPDIYLTAIFPETERSYTTSAALSGDYLLDNLHTDGTVIIIAFDNNTGASASYSSVVTSSSPNIIVNLSLTSTGVVNPELLNGNFADGLTGWSTSGPVQIIDRDSAFGSQN